MHAFDWTEPRLDEERKRLIEAVLDALSNELSEQEGCDLDLRRLHSLDRRACQVILAKIDRFADDLLIDEWHYLKCLEETKNAGS